MAGTDPWLIQQRRDEQVRRETLESVGLSQETFKVYVTGDKVEKTDFTALQPGQLLEIVYKEGEKDWTDKVLALLDDKEILEGYPTADGLRRIATQLYGPFQSKTTVHAVSIDYAAVTVDLTFGHDFPGYSSVANEYGTSLGVSASHARRISGSAECSVANSKAPYINSPLAVAETKAIGRALRSALCLRGINTAEERGANEAGSTPNVPARAADDTITDSQLKFINRKCKDLGVDARVVIDKLIGLDVPIDQLKESDGLKISEQISLWQRGEENLPLDLGTYREDWQK